MLLRNSTSFEKTLQSKNVIPTFLCVRKELLIYSALLKPSNRVVLKIAAIRRKVFSSAQNDFNSIKGLTWQYSESIVSFIYDVHTSLSMTSDFF